MILVAGSCKRGQAPVRTVQNINRDWNFILEDLPGAFDRDFDDTDWRTLDMPHDFPVEGKRIKTTLRVRQEAFIPGGSITWGNPRAGHARDLGSSGLCFWSF